MLDRILVHKRMEVAARQAVRSEAAMVAAAAEAAPPRDFAAALRRDSGPVRVIAELKKASPSRGLLCPIFAPDDLARAYTAAGAAALSVITDRTFFQGDLHNLTVARRVSNRPLLCKDFIIQSYQIYEARAAGADAVLLIAAALEQRELKNLAELAQELGMAALIEAHDEKELQRALECETGLIGINNRDLRTFQVDLKVTERLAPMVPPEVVTVSESGLRRASDVVRVAAVGVDAVLVGEALVTAADVQTKLQELAGATRITAAGPGKKGG